MINENLLYTMIREKYEVHEYVNSDAHKWQYPMWAMLPNCTNAVCISTVLISAVATKELRLKILPETKHK